MTFISITVNKKIHCNNGLHWSLPLHIRDLFNHGGLANQHDLLTMTVHARWP